MGDKKGYIGRIRNGGSQVVHPVNQQVERKKNLVKKGGDLRTGKK